MSESRGQIERHRSKGLIVDTNLLLVLVVGLGNPGFVGRFRRTEAYTPNDFLLLRHVVGLFPKIILTPQVLAELTNLLPAAEDDATELVHDQVVQTLSQAFEIYVPKDELLPNPLLRRVGFTDLSLLRVALDGDYLVLTDDLRASVQLRSGGCSVLNFVHLREELLQWSGD